MEWKVLADQGNLRGQSGSSRKSFRPSGFSVALSGSRYTCISPEWWSSNTSNPRPVRQHDYLVSATFGKGSDGGAHWVSRYSQKRWNYSKNLRDGYPALYDKIKVEGLDSMEYCVLGPKGVFYVRWRSGYEVYKASREVKDTIAECSDNDKILTLAFGYGGSYLIYHGRSFSSPGSVEYDLRGHYEDLESFLEKNEGLQILALTLNGKKPDEYILIYKLPGRSTSKCRYHLDSEDISADIGAWWDMTCEIAND